LDLFSGIAGDMFIAALLDLGVDAHPLERELKKLKLDGWHLHIARGQKSAISGVKFKVHLGHEPKHNHGHGYEHSHEHQAHEHSHEHGHTHHHHEHEHEHE